MSGETLTGFAHGVSAIVFFLIEDAARFEDKRSKSSAERGLRWLVDHAMSTDDAHCLLVVCIHENAPVIELGLAFKGDRN